MYRVWLIPEEKHPDVGEMYRKGQWSNLVWIFNHYRIGGPGMVLCDCSGSWEKMKIVFEKFKDIYAEQGDNEMGAGEGSARKGGFGSNLQGGDIS